MGYAIVPLSRFNTLSFTFDGTSGKGAAGTTSTFFTVTGEILITALSVYVVTTLTQNLATPTLALGVVNSTALFIGATTATNLSAGEFWTEATGGGTADAGVALPATMYNILCTSNIVGTVGGTNNINGGVLRLDMYWLPLSSNAGVT